MRISDWSSDVCSSDLARAEVHGDAPIVSAELPPSIEGRAGERFEGVLPPVSIAPCFSIRKPAERLYSLDDYVTDGIMTQAAADRLKGCVTQRYNILVAGSTRSGKTTRAKALLSEMAWVDERVILLEDTRRSAARLVGKECVSTCRFRGSPYH